jgi:hypothetical protein
MVLIQTSREVRVHQTSDLRKYHQNLVGQNIQELTFFGTRYYFHMAHVEVLS